MIAMSRSPGYTSVMFSSSANTSPDSGFSSPTIVRRSVVFPAPGGPSTAKNSPSSTASETSLSAVTAPKRIGDVLEPDRRHQTFTARLVSSSNRSCRSESKTRPTLSPTRGRWPGTPTTRKLVALDVEVDDVLGAERLDQVHLPRERRVRGVGSDELHVLRADAERQRAAVAVASLAERQRRRQEVHLRRSDEPGHEPCSPGALYSSSGVPYCCRRPRSMTAM